MAPNCSRAIISAKPMMPFSGVRSSWLIVARNAVLARLAASASSRAARIVSTSPRNAASRDASRAAFRLSCRVFVFAPGLRLPAMAPDVKDIRKQPV